MAFWNLDTQTGSAPSFLGGKSLLSKSAFVSINGANLAVKSFALGGGLDGSSVDPYSGIFTTTGLATAACSLFGAVTGGQSFNEIKFSDPLAGPPALAWGLDNAVISSLQVSYGGGALATQFSVAAGEVTGNTKAAAPTSKADARASEVLAIPGKSTTFLPIQSFDFSANSVAGGKPTFAPIEVMAAYDPSLPELFGNHYASLMLLEKVPGGGKAEELLAASLRIATINSFEISGGSGNSLPEMSFSISFGAVRWKVGNAQMKTPGGSSGSWNRIYNDQNWGTFSS